MTSPEWQARPERGNRLALAVMRRLSLWLGRPASRLILRGIAAWFVALAPAARRASSAYLARALGRPARLADVYRHLFTFATTVHDRVYFLADRFDLFDLALEGEEHVAALLAQRRGALLFGAHLGSFESARAIGRRQPDLRIALAMYEDNARKIAAALDAVNPDARPEIIALGRVEAMLTVRDRLAEGAFVGVLPDRTFGDAPTRPVQLLGDTARLPVGPFRMAQMLGAPVLFMAGLHLGGNRYRVRFVPIADFADTPRERRDEAMQAAMARYVAELERCLHEAPDNWFNFFDFWAGDRAGDTACKRSAR